MKKSTLIIAGLVLLMAGLSRAEDARQPIVVASAFPMMAPAAGNPVRLLPGMMPSPALPQPLISDLSNAPNPFDSRKGGLDGQTQISYQLAQNAKVSIEIYSLLGMKVRGWDFAPGSNGAQTGLNTLLWDGTNASGQKVSKGGYLAQIVVETPQTTVTVIRKIGVIH